MSDEEPGIRFSERNGHSLKFHEKSHRYYLKAKGSEKFVPMLSTTTYNKSYPQSEKLIQWRIKQGIEEAITGKFLGTAGSIGTICHELFLKFEQGKNPTIPDIPEVQNAVKLFQKWYKEKGHKDKILKQEALLCDPDRRIAGTLDRLVERNNKIILSDFKTSGGIYGSYLFQLASYHHMLGTWYGIVPDAWEILRFGKEDELEDIEYWDNKELMRDYADQTINRNLPTYRFNAIYKP